ncbi:hypothetical protein N9811_06250 [Bacteroidia bacterium]|nr:hypothetical protein [Bacteroidia bacterium]
MPYNEFPYDENTCTNKPRNANIQLYVTRDYNRLTNNNNPRAEVNIDAIKQNLAQGVPVVIGMMAGDILMQAMQDKKYGCLRVTMSKLKALVDMKTSQKVVQ